VINFATTYALYFTLFAALGISMYGIREVAKHSNDQAARSQIFSELFSIRCISTLICVIVYLLSIFFVPALRGEREFLLIAGISLLFAIVNVDWFFTGRENMEIITIRSLMVKLATFAGLFIFVRTREDALAYLILTLIATICGHLWNFGYLLTKEVKITFFNLNVKRHLKSVLTLFAANIAMSIYTMLGTLMLGFMSNYTEVGYFTSAIKINNLVLPIVTAMAIVVVARINTLKGAEQEGQIRELLERSFGFMFTLAVPIAIGLIVISPRFVPFFFGQEFALATVSMRILSLLIPIIGLSNLFGIQILLGFGKDKQFMIAVLLGTVSNFILNLALITPFGGAMGASIASVIAEILVAVATIVFAVKVMPIHIKVKSIVQPLLAASLIIPISMMTSYWTSNNWNYLFFTITISALLYFCTMSFVLKNEQVNYILNIVLQKIKSVEIKNNQI
jgi:O-antigen/teichoic acid export membrane protein